VIKTIGYILTFLLTFLVGVKLFAPGDRLETIVSQSLVGTKGKYTIFIKNLKTGESYAAHEHEALPSGSLYKLWVMAAAFEAIKEGRIKEDEILSNSIPALNAKFGIDSAGPGELTTGGITLSAKNAITQMITISHNYAALLLADKVGTGKVEKMISTLGLKESSYGNTKGPPTTTAYDTANYFELLYKGEIVDADYSKQMIEVLKKQQLNDRIPKYLPKGTLVAHKTGEIDYYKHDAGIVFTNAGDYILVVLSKSEFPGGAAERVALLSKAVFDHFEKEANRPEIVKKIRQILPFL
jgi:beta-lactamase class A